MPTREYQKEEQTPITVFAPHPPPLGGMANWSVLMKKTVVAQEHQRLVGFFDTSIKGRSRFDNGFIGRVRLLTHAREIVRQLAGIAKVVSARNSRLMHSCTSGGLGFLRDVYLGALTRMLRKEFVVHVHNGRLPTVLAQRSVERVLFEIVARFLADSIVVLDQKSLAAVKERFPRVRVYLVPNGISKSEQPVSAAQKQAVIVFAGWVVRSKGIEELLSAWQQLRLPGWKLQILGCYEPTYLASLRNRFRFDSVEVLGEVSHKQVQEVLRNSMVMCLPSHTEGFPMVVLEAMLAECAIIATDVGALPEILRDGAGVVVPAKDEMALRQAIQQLIDDPNQIRSLTERARTAVRTNYEMSHIYSECRAIWRLEQ